MQGPRTFTVDELARMMARHAGKQKGMSDEAAAIAMLDTEIAKEEGS
jgi:2-C-methyl-D-erythritol 4-phosphate cytidylyltransferase